MANKTFGTSVGVKSGGMGEPVKEPTLEEKVDLIANNSANMFQEHANALNAIALWIAEKDPKVKAQGNVVNWAMKKMKDEEELKARRDKWNAKLDK